MSFEKSQMRYNDGKVYKWDKPADVYSPYYTEGSGKTSFDRSNGNEVLFLINHLFKDFPGEPTLSHYQKAEEMIVFDLPSWRKSHKSLVKWILEYWDKREKLLV
ncbi:hypothetical protein JN11_01259 [Mucilaginibacter frigoritolerans]|jgi:hypothetical protein|uniref:Uncharacterized protein n=1 Tax=Mucilaginibacter frigoritolerans TaxID=652788 RepID=A0A562UAA7_9SPHI|nr:hypothetical protein [Mucilaginibacter frigoritolerans]TWJ02287.1 hypothetical protein JN11_01259 [Mucilaginibacter frigoritolerans]